jgi:FMN-dependent NADH-azoreductase
MERTMNIPQVNSSPRLEVSQSTRLATRLVGRLRDADPEATLTVRDLGRTPHPVLALADSQVPYLRTVLAFLGLADVHFIFAEGLSMGADAEETGIASAHAQIEEAVTV